MKTAELEKAAWKFANEETVFPISMTGAEIQHSAEQAKNSFIAGHTLATTEKESEIKALESRVKELTEERDRLKATIQKINLKTRDTVQSDFDVVCDIQVICNEALNQK